MGTASQSGSRGRIDEVEVVIDEGTRLSLRTVVALCGGVFAFALFIAQMVALRGEMVQVRNDVAEIREQLVSRGLVRPR